VTRVLLADDAAIAEAAHLLRSGQLVAMPTETVYGLAGDAFNPEALTRIFSAKERPTFDPLIVHVAPALLSSTQTHDPLEALAQLELIDLSLLSASAQQDARCLIARFWPGPLTLLFPRHSRVPDLATSGLPRVGLRMPSHLVAQSLIERAGKPLAAPSANRFGRISPTRAEHVLAELNGRIPMILDGGSCSVGVESSVLSLEPLSLLRPGGVSQTEIEKTLGKAISRISAPHAALSSEAQSAPGMLASHYAPRKPMSLFPYGAKPTPDQRLGVLFWSELRATRESSGFARTESLCPGLGEAHAQCAEAARTLFARMRSLDEDARIERIAVESCPFTDGLGHAITDRLARAAHRA